MIEGVLIALVLLLLVCCVAPGFSPCTVFGIASALNLLTFYGIYELGIGADSLGGFWGLRSNYDATKRYVASAYALLLGLALVVAAMTYLLRGVCNIETERRTHSSVAFDLASIPFLRSRPVYFLILIANGTFVFHALDLDWSVYSSHDTYLFVRNGHNVGLSNSISLMVHRAIPSIGLLWSVLTAFYICLQDRRGIALTLPLFFYLVMLNLGAVSRVAAFQFVIIAMFIQLCSRKRISSSAVLLGVLAILLYYFIIDLRASGRYGLYEFAAKLGNPEREIFAFLISNLRLNFGGGFVLAHAFGQTDLWYPTAYKVLSFSPVISAIDGFAAIRHFEHRVSFWTPFNSIAEIYHFGWEYMYLYALLIAVILCRLQWCWYKLPPLLFAIIGGPAYIGMFIMHMYPMRNNLRYFVVSVTLSLVLPIALKRLRGFRQSYASRRSAISVP